MKRIIMLAATATAIAASVAIARRRRRPFHAVELADPDVIIDEVVVHFGVDSEPLNALRH